MGHDHGHHHHSLGANKRTLVISQGIILLYTIVELIGGILTNSLALLADAGHMLSDAISLAIALLAFTFSTKAANYSKTYGYKRFEILAAAVNGVTLVFMALYIFYEAIDRFLNPPEIVTNGMVIIASIGLLVNMLVAWIMIRGSDVKGNLNMRGAYLHVISDMLGSIGAIVAALLIMFFGWGWADPLASVLVAVLVLRSGYIVSKEALHILMEGTPHNVDIDKIIQTIQKPKDIVSVHDLHVWSISSEMNALSCRAVVDEKKTIAESEQILRQIEHDLGHHNIHHVTIQLEMAKQLHEKAVLCKIQAKSADSHHVH